MTKYTPRPKQASKKEQDKDTSRNVKVSPENKPHEKLPGKTDSGPEPDVFGREIPPQDED